MTAAPRRPDGPDSGPDQAVAIARIAAKRAERSGPQPDPAIYYGLLGEIVEAADATTEADPVGVLVSLLAAVGVLVGPDPHVMIGYERHPLLIWPVLVGQTGRGRKGGATSTAETFLRAAAPDFKDVSVTGLSSGEGLIERIKDLDEGDDESGPRSRWAGTDDKRLLVIEPEFAGVMTRAGRPGNTLSSVLRLAWDGRALGVLTKAQVIASWSHIAVIGHVTPVEFRMAMSERDVSGGTYNRFLPVCVERSKLLPLPEEADADLVEELAGHLRDGILRARTIGRVGMSPHAAKLWGEIYQELDDLSDEDSAWSNFIQRAAPYTRRIAALYAVLDGVDQVTPDHLNAAWALVRYSRESVRYLLGDVSGDRRLDKVRKAIDDAPEQTLTKTQISALFSGNADAATLNSILARLTADGSYEQIEIPTGGRPATAYRRTKPVVSSSFVAPAK